MAALLCGPSPAADAVAPKMATDVNVVSAIDVSDSIGRYEEWLQQTGLVRALVHHDFLRAVTAGPQRRIGFAVFTWSSDRKFDVLVPWTVIGSAEDAAHVSQVLASVHSSTERTTEAAIWNRAATGTMMTWRCPIV